MIKTEMRNPNTMKFSFLDTASMLQLMNEENYNACKAVEAVTDRIAEAVDAVSEGLKAGGRLFYMGCGTSGRLGVIDAAECPPTFGVDKDRVIGIIAGGEKCMTRASENEEDNGAAGIRDLAAYDITENDVVVGLSVAGNASYVYEAIKYAKEKGCVTIGISSNEESLLAKTAQIAICPDTGAEVITGSTRLKAGTAQKLILNMISTCAMAKQGYVYENLMINLKPTNIKLKQRVIRITSEITGCSEAESEKYLELNDWNIKDTVSYVQRKEQE